MEDRRLSLQFLLGRLQFLSLLGFGVILKHVADIDVVHFWEEFALGDVACIPPRAHMTETASRVCTERIAAIGRSRLVSKCIKLRLAQLLGMVPFAVGSVRAMAS